MSQAIQKREEISLATIGGTQRDANTVNRIMEWAKANCHLIAPATAVGQMPEWLGVAFMSVSVDLTTTGSGDFMKYVSGDVYAVGEKLALSKNVLEKIATAAGLSWDPQASGRVDDGSNPHYCRWKAVANYRSFDGAPQTLTREKEMDLRSGSAQVQALMERYDAALAKWKAGKGRYEPKHPSGQIREMRLHIQAHAETKAQLRVIRQMGIKSYTPEELKKPFVCARVMFTGQSKDPDQNAIFASKIADSFLGGVTAMYGRSALPAARAEVPLRISASVPYEDDEEDDGYGDDRGGSPPQQQYRQEEQPRQEERPRQQPQGEGGVYKIPGGKSKDTPLDKATDKDLEYWHHRIGNELNSGESRYPERDAALHAALDAELAKRKGGSTPAQGGQGGAQQELGKL